MKLCCDRWKKFIQSATKMDLKTYDNIRKIATGRGDDYTTGSSLNYPYFTKYYKLIAKDLSKQQKLLIQKKYHKLMLLEI